MKRYSTLICLAGILCALIIITNERYQIKVNYSNNMELLKNQEYAGYYEQIDDNRLKCDLATVSSIVYQMKADGFIEYRYDATESEIDITLIKDDIKIRMHYNSDQEFTSICKDYKISYLPLTYIIERKV